MKFLLLIFTGLNLIACGNAEWENVNMPTAPGTSPVADPGQIEDKEVLTLNASKMYFPDDMVDTVLDLNEAKEISLPAEIPVVSGNAGNYYSLLTIDNITCYYKGGSAISYPLGGRGSITDIVNGQKYHLSICEDENNVILDLKSGDSVLVQDSVGLKILDGDSTEATVVKLVIEVL